MVVVPPMDVAALNHEVWDNSVEDNSVIEPVIGQEDEIVHGDGRPFCE